MALAPFGKGAYTPIFTLNEALEKADVWKCCLVIGRGHDGSLSFTDSNNLSIDDICIMRSLLDRVVADRFAVNTDG